MHLKQNKWYTNLHLRISHANTVAKNLQAGENMYEYTEFKKEIFVLCKDHGHILRRRDRESFGSIQNQHFFSFFLTDPNF